MRAPFFPLPLSPSPPPVVCRSPPPSLLPSLLAFSVLLGIKNVRVCQFCSGLAAKSSSFASTFLSYARTLRNVHFDSFRLGFFNKIFSCKQDSYAKPCVRLFIYYYCYYYYRHWLSIILCTALLLPLIIISVVFLFPWLIGVALACSSLIG